MGAERPPRRRWFQFGLGTMFVVVTLVAVFLAYHVNWIRQRHELRARNDALVASSGMGLRLWQVRQHEQHYIEPPAGLYFFGERGVAWIDLVFDAKNEAKMSGITPAGVRTAERLFPEAKISWMYLPQNKWIDQFIGPSQGFMQSSASTMPTEKTQ